MYGPQQKGNILKSEKLPISVCIITLNEQLNIGACIESADFASEIIIVDSFSTDQTRKISESYGARFFEHKFEGHIQQKNIALSYATFPWVIAIDADERISQAMKTRIFEIFQGEPKYDGYRFHRTTWYLTKWIRHGRFYPDRQLRLFKKDKATWGGSNPHDKIKLSGTFCDLNEDILHYSYRDIANHIQTSNNFSSIQANILFNRGKNRFIVFKMILKSIWTFLDSYLLRAGFMDGREGFIIAVISAFSMFARYAKVYELDVKQR